MVALATPARAQDAHYWSLQVGSRATLLGGSVVALDTDLSAAYYNPGSLVRVAEGSALSMFAKTVTTLTLSLDTSTPLAAESDIGASAPGMFAARVPGVHLFEDDVITFSYLVRQSSKLDLTGAVLSSPTVPAEALDFFAFQDIYDGWYGLSWARDVGGFGAGVSVFFSSVSYRQRLETKDIVLESASEAGALSENVYYSFACRRVVAKGGVSWTGGPLSLGASLTLPSLRLPWSSGTMSVGRNLVAQDSVLVSQIAFSRQEDLDADYREPIAVGLGAQFELGSFGFYAAAEWFGSVDEYDVLETRPLTSQVPPQEFVLPLTQRREDVLNIGGGVSVEATSWLSFYGSVRTDRSYRDPADRTFVGLGAYDITQVTFGIGVSSDEFEVILGGLAGEGDSDGQVVLSPLPGSPSVASRTEFEQRGFIVAFSASF
ncbi:MAG TPA: hypothetical protein VEC56_10635 [Candidatus Krumholzibacteria bacterium]|nr:hypothetical protein [Candidatus Krumholzibacteria bacterium]